MCKNPHYIAVRGKYRRLGASSTVAIPCGHCDECRKNKSLQYAVRAYYDYKFAIEHSGYSMFDTLTYDEKHVPRYSVNGITFKCFKADDIRRFKANMLDRLAHLLALKLDISFTAKNRDEILFPTIRDRYSLFIVSEYGAQRKRPHYHILITTTLPIKPYEMENLYLNSWIDEDGEMLGGVENISADDKCVRGFGKLMYISGYLNKDDDFYTEIIKRIGLPAWNNLSRKVKNDFQPRAYIPRGFGRHLADYYNVEELLNNGVVKIPDNRNGVRLVDVPKYYLRQIFYDEWKETDDIGRVHRYQHLNETGCDYNIKNAEKLLQNEQQKFIDALVSGVDYYLENGLSYTAHIRQLLEMADITLYELAQYKCLWQNRIVHDDAMIAYDPVSMSSRIGWIYTTELFDSHESSYNVSKDVFLDNILACIDELRLEQHFQEEENNRALNEAKKKTRKKKCDELHNRLKYK